MGALLWGSNQVQTADGKVVEVETGAHESVYFPKGHSAAKNNPRINKF